jgi:hypothetical protein
MDKRMHLLATLSALALGAGVGSIPTTAATKFAGVDLQQCVVSTGKTEAECACEAALDSGDPKVLASFLELYREEYSDTACAALATTLVIPNENGRPPGEGGGASGN